MDKKQANMSENSVSPLLTLAKAICIASVVGKIFTSNP